MKLLLLLPAVLLFGTPALFPPSAAGQANPAGEKATNAKASGEVPAHVKQIYNMDCAICHGPRGDGKTDLAKDMALTLDDWTSPASLSTKSDKELYDIIRKGKDKMPPEDTGRAKDAEVQSLVNYIRSLSKSPAPEEAAPAATTAATSAPSSN